MFELEIATYISHALAFTAGLAFDRLVLKKLDLGGGQITVNWSESIKVAVLMLVFIIFLVSLVQSQFFNGAEPSTVLTLGGIFSFGSLIGEGDFFKKILSGFLGKKN